MKAMKRLVCLLLAAMLLLGMAACSQKTEPTPAPEAPAQPEQNAEPAAEPAAEPEADPFAEHMDISIAIWDIENAITHADTDVVLKYIEDKFNITIEPVNITYANYNDQLTLWAASNQMPDIMAGIATQRPQFAELVNDGVIRNIPDEMIAKYPNVQEYLSSPSAAKCIVNGEFHGIYRASWFSPEGTMSQGGIWYRWDLAQAAGVTEEPETWDDLFAMVQKIQEANPGMTGITTSSRPTFAQRLMTYTAPDSIIDGLVARWVDNGDGTLVPAYLAGENLGDNALKVFNMAREMYDNGVIDPDIAVITKDEAVAKFVTGKAAAISVTNILDVNGAFVEAGDIDSDVYRLMNIIPSIDGVKHLAPTEDWSENYIAADVSDEKLDRILALYDWMLSEEGTIVCFYGIEGETYEMTENGAVFFADGTVKCPSFGFTTTFARWSQGFVRPAGFEQPYTPYEYTNNWQANLLEEMNGAPRQDGYDPAKDAAAKQAFMALGSDFVLHMEEDVIKLMTGSEAVETMWNDILAEYERKGMSDAIAAVNEAIK